MSSPEPRVPVPWGSPEAPRPAAEWGPPELASDGVGDSGLGAVADPVGAAYARGVEAGFAEGMARAREELVPVREAFAILIQQIESELRTVRRVAGQNLTALALVAARWLFQREATLDPTMVQSLIHRAVGLLPAGIPIEIHASPGDLDALGSHLEPREADRRAGTIHWVADPGLERGSFRIASPERLIDGRADVALRSLYERLASE